MVSLPKGGSRQSICLLSPYLVLGKQKTFLSYARHSQRTTAGFWHGRKVLIIFLTVCKSELLGIVYSSYRIEETASAYAENGHNAAILGKKVQNSLPATTKSKKDAGENGHNRASLCKKTKNQSKNSYLYPKLVQTRSNPSKVVTC